MNHALDSTGRETLAARYHFLLQALAAEIEAALSAVVRNSLSEFQDHVAQQESLCLDLQVLHRELTATGVASPELPNEREAALRMHIASAEKKIRTLNAAYSSFLAHSAQSVALMRAVCKSFQDQWLPALRSREQNPLSCEV